MKSYTSSQLPNITKNNEILKDTKQIVLTASNFNSFIRTNKITNMSLDFNSSIYSTDYNFFKSKCRTTTELKKITYDKIFYRNCYLQYLYVQEYFLPVTHKISRSSKQNRWRSFRAIDHALQ